VIGLEQAVHLLAKSSPKHSAQYGLSSRDVNRCPARELLQLLQVKQSLCHGSFLYVTPPLVMICNKEFDILLGQIASSVCYIAMDYSHYLNT